MLTLNQPQKLKISMSYTEELLTKADEVIPRVTFEDYKNDINEKIMIDVRQFDELQASTIKSIAFCSCTLYSEPTIIGSPFLSNPVFP